VEHLHGAVARVGKDHGIPTPINALLTEILVGVARGEIPSARLAHHPERLLAALQTRKREM
jgi:hypothetical protein